MKGDFSRKTFDRARHYGGVLMQQGRVQVDADWNEQLAIQRHRDETEALDVIGECGAPKHEAGFRVQPAPDGLDLLISPGRYYVHGRMCELEGTPVEALFQSATQVTVAHWHVDGADFAANQYVELAASGVAPAVVKVSAAAPATRQLTFGSSIAAFASATGLTVRRLTTYLTQPDLPNAPFGVPPGPGLPPELDLPDGTYLLYLDVWPRHITALDDDRIREKALGGPDTATRIKTVWQLKLWPGPEDGAPLPAGTDCGTPVLGWDDLTRPSTGRLAARTEPAPPTDDPCILPPGAGYLGLENQLYRVEVHKGGVLGTDPITIKWSRDNGSVVKALVKIPTTTDYTVSDTGPDDVLGLANGQWVEQVDDEIDLKATPRNLFQFTMDPITGKVTLPFPVDENRHPQIRRWDSPNEVAIPFPPVGGGWIDLESGIQVRFEPGTYRTGDYWLIPARTVLGDIEWAKDGASQPLARLRHGIRHEYCRIGVLTVAGGVLTVEDCRNEFPPLTEVKGTSYSCCTFTVGDGTKYVGDFSLLQEAVDHLPAEGGQICVFPGTYVENVLIDGRKNVHIKGCGLRTRIVSKPPNADGVASAVIHIVKSQGVKIESLAIEAAETGPGVLADGEKPSRHLVLEKLWVTAARDSGIKVRSGQDVTIEHCRVRMTDANGRWPGIFLRATDASVRENEVVGTLLDMPPETVFTLKGALAVSGLQLGGGGQRIRVHENLFHGVSGQGITLGSMVELDANGRPDPNGGGGWVADGDDPCNNCDEPSSGDRPGGDGGDDRPPRLRSEGDLYDIDIRRNRIFDVGLDGIGVIHFFDLFKARRAVGLVRVEDLAIVENRIQRSVRRAFAPIPPNMLDLMAYGGISLALVEGLVIRDNRIEDIGVGGLLPVCGIFVLHGEGIEIGRNHVLNAGLPGREAAAAAIVTGRRGGIHVVYARTLEVAGGAGPTPGAEAAFAVAAVVSTGLRRAEVAVVVEENTVDVVRGQALSLGVLGPTSVVSNRLISRGLVPLDLLALVREGAAQGQANVLTHLSSLVAIVALGNTGASKGPANLNAAVSYQPAGRSFAVAAEAASGNVLFDDNQCLLDLVHGPSERGPALPGNLMLPAILILSLDDLGFQDNQCDCLVREGQMATAALLLGLFSVRVVSNRFKETLGRALFSAVSFAAMNMTAHNQANHCLMVVGPVFAQDKPNHILVGAYQKDYCQGAERTFTQALKGLVG